MSRGYINTVKKMMEMARGREIILWGMDALTKCIYRDFSSCGFRVKYFISDDEEINESFDNIKIKRSIDLFLEDRNDVFIAVFILRDHGKAYQRLVDMGYIYQEDFFIGGIGGYFHDYDTVDSLLGYNRYGTGGLGFQIYGENSTGVDTYKILTLGGSTTDWDMGNNKCWPEWLYEKIRSMHEHIIVINGGMCGYTTQQEFLKLVRDGLFFKPNMVITFDGYNNTLGNASMVEGFPYLHPYAKKVYDRMETKGDFAPDTMGIRNPTIIAHGIKRELQESYEYWIEAIRNIYGVSIAHGIKYYGFLQPMLGTSKTIIGKELSTLIEVMKTNSLELERTIKQQQVFYKQIHSFLAENDFVYDLTEIFDEKGDMFYDTCHATDEGNEVIAEAIFQCIVPELNRWKENDKGGEQNC